LENLGFINFKTPQRDGKLSKKLRYKSPTVDGGRNPVNHQLREKVVNIYIYLPLICRVSNTSQVVC